MSSNTNNPQANADQNAEEYCGQIYSSDQNKDSTPRHKGERGPLALNESAVNILKNVVGIPEERPDGEKRLNGQFHAFRKLENRKRCPVCSANGRQRKSSIECVECMKEFMDQKSHRKGAMPLVSRKGRVQNKALPCI